MTEQGRVLALALATEPIVGSNLRGAVSGAGWLYALPRLEHPRIVCLGAPGRASLIALACAGDVLVVEGGRRARKRVARDILGSGLANVEVIGGPAAGPDEGPIDLLVLRDRAAVAHAVRHGWLDLLAPHGLVVAEPSAAAIAAGIPARAGTPAIAYRLAASPFRGEVKAIIPADDHRLRRALESMGLAGSVTRRRKAAKIERRVLGLRPFRSMVVREMLVSGPGLATHEGVPAYVRDLATERVGSLDGWDWAVAARGEYDSQKVLMLLAPPGPSGPTGVVKITRSDVHAARLRNEAAALERLAALPVATGRVPEPLFAGTHAGRAIVGISLIDGAAFSARSKFDASDPLLADAMGWLTDLAGATVQRVPTADVTGALAALLDRYQRIYRPSSWEVGALAERLGGIGANGETFPVVLQHGDPGAWNLMVRPDGRVVFLDWEAYEPFGLPLWDLFYFFRSYAIAAGRRAGVRDGVDASAAHMLGESALADRFVSAVLAYRERIDLPAAAIEPLLLGCWIHRALKEASRLTEKRLQGGLSASLIRRTLGSSGAPTLRRFADG